MDWKIVGIFLASFAVGMVLVYFSPMEYKTVFVYPTPNNVDDLQYKDSAGQCFRFSSKEVDCTGSANKIPSQ
jgi:hypothetical protein